MPRKPKVPQENARFLRGEPQVIGGWNNADVAAPVSNTITNTRKGFTLHLGDGRSLAFGESVEVGAEQAAGLRERGLAE